jgi:hypothetical protein
MAGTYFKTSFFFVFPCSRSLCVLLPLLRLRSLALACPVLALSLPCAFSQLTLRLCSAYPVPVLHFSAAFAPFLCRL